MDSSNFIYEIRSADGTVDYSINLGRVLYNDRILDISNLIIPIRDQVFFTLPEDKGKFAIVNVYYGVDDGVFVFDLVKKSDTFIQNLSIEALSNYLPIAQFVVRESFGSFTVLVVNQYSKMATFSITDVFTQGDQGAQGPVGDTGFIGYTGKFGETGVEGLTGYVGPQGVTGFGAQGTAGAQGVTGYRASTDLLFYSKFKAADKTLLDYSVYERDFSWGASGAGYTGVGYTGIGLGATGMIFIPENESSFVVEDGVVDNCHSITYRGGQSSYRHDSYIASPGTIQAWVRLDVAPNIDFSFTPDPLNSLKIFFTDLSLFYPTVWEWDLGLGGDLIKTQNFVYLFSTHGTYTVTLKASNAAGASERIKIITI
jgi:hypothetical protein